MVYLTIEAATGDVVAASAGHPPPLLVSPDGTVDQLDVRGLALGVEPCQTYEERDATRRCGRRDRHLHRRRRGGAA